MPDRHMTYIINHGSPLEGGASNLPPLHDDILRGAAELAEFLYGHQRRRRAIYHLVEKGNLPVFWLGSTICGRRSTLLAWIEEQEARASRKREVAA